LSDEPPIVVDAEVVTTNCGDWSPRYVQGEEEPICSRCTERFDAHVNPFGKPATCEPCTLFRAPGIVRGTGPRDVDLMFVAEAPGAEEVNEPYYRKDRMQPLIGGSGRLFSSLLSHAGITRGSVFLTNTVKCRPPANRLPTAHEIRCCAPFLIEEIETRDPKEIVVLGEVALNVLTDKKGIGLWRGVPIEGFGDRKVFPTWHPAFIARAQYNWPFAVHDLARAKAESTFPEIRRVPYDIVRDASAARDGADLLASARVRGAATFDFETTGLSSQRDSIVYCGLAARPDKAHVLHWSPSTQQLFQTLLDDPAIEIVGQNILYFDLPFAAEKGVRIDKAWLKIFDTMVGFHLANASYGQTKVSEQNAGTFRLRGAEKDLAMIASCHTDIPYWKSRENYKKDLLGVCGLDVIATDRSALDPRTGIKAELASYDMLDLYYKHVLPVHPVLYNMTKRGVRIDIPRAVGWAKVLSEEADKLEVILKEGLGDPFLNLNSPKQLMELLYVKMGLPVQYVQDKKKGLRPTANAEAVEALAAMRPENKILGSIVTIRHLRKMDSTYVQPALEGDEFLHPRFGVSKAATGRFNSWDPNAQNVPEQMRDIWIPDDDDCVLLSADWSQIEWRLAMVLSGDPVGLKLLASGVDNHRAVASETLGKPIELVTDEERYSSKFIVYGLGYGRGAESIADHHGLEINFVKAFIARFFARFAVFARWRDDNVRFARKHHYLANAFKRRRWWYTHQVTEQYNYPMQSNAADMMYDALIVLDRQLPKGADLRLTVHDEVVLNVRKEVVREAWNCVRDVMQSAWPQLVAASADEATVKHFYPQGWHCPVDIHVGTDWEMCKSKNPARKAAAAALAKHLGVAA
jgi:uracil-DNA glycosylase family 4